MIFTLIIFATFELMKTSLQNIVPVACLIILSTLIACNNSGNTPTGPQNGTTAPSAAEQVKTLFQQNCVSCHGVDGTLNPNPAANLQQITIDSSGVVKTIQNGNGGMPSFKNALAETDITALAVYVKTLHK